MQNNILKYTRGWLSLNKPSGTPQAAQEALEDDFECVCINCRFDKLEEQNRKLFELVDVMAADAYEAKAKIDKLSKRLTGK
jgi:hypothetical protein